MKTLERLKLEGKVALDLNIASNSLSDFSGNGNTATATGGYFSNSLFGREYSSNVGDVLSIADDTSLQLTEGFLIFFCGSGFRSQTSTETLITKRDGGGTNYQLYIVGSFIAYFDGTSVRIKTENIIGKKMVAVKIADGEIPVLYVDGENKGNFSGTVNVTPDDAPLYISSFNGAEPVKSPLSRAIILNDSSISEDDIAAIHEEYMQSRGATLTTIRNPIFNKESMFGSDDATIRYDFETFSPDGKLLDLSGNADNGTIDWWRQAQKSNILGKQMRFNAADNVVTTNNSSLSGASQFSRRLIVSNIDWGTTSALFDFGNVGVTMQVRTTGDIFFYLTTGGQYGVYDLNSTPELLDIIFDFDGTGATNADKMKVYVNGEELTASSFVGTLPTSVKVSATPEYLGAIVTSQPVSADYHLFEAYDSPQGANALSWFKKWNTYFEYKELPENQPPTTSVVTAGNPIPFGDWKNISGNITVGEEDGSKYYKTSSASMQMYLDLPNGYGTYIFEYEKGDGEQLEFLIAANQATVRTASGFNAYLIALQTNESYGLYSVTSGSAASIQQGTAGEITVGAKQKCAITRDREGNFKIYHFNGSSWSEVISATNNTFTTAGKITYEVRTGNSENSFNGLTYYPMPLAKDQLPN